MTRAGILSIVLALGLLAVAGSAAAKDATVRVGHDSESTGAAYLRYYPETVAIEAGDAVLWTADSNTPHTVTGFPPGPGAFDSSPVLRPDDPTLAKWFGPGGFLLPGQAFNHTFNSLGSFVYVCKIHPGMVGHIEVVNGTAAAPALPPLAGNASSGPTPTVWVDAGWGSGDTTMDRFAPADFTIANGTMVVWTNKHSDEPHTVTGFRAGTEPPPNAPPTTPPVFDSSPEVGAPPAGFDGPQGVLTKAGANKELRHVFTEPGNYPYFCKLHGGMWGSVIVLAKANTTQPATTGTGKSTPAPPAMGVALALLGAALVASRRRA